MEPVNTSPSAYPRNVNSPTPIIKNKRNIIKKENPFDMTAEEIQQFKKDYIELDRKPENWIHGWMMCLKKVRELNKISQARN